MREVASLALITLAALAGCAAPTEEGAPAKNDTGTEDVVGITDLALLERAFGLKPAAGAGDVQALQAGECYRGLVTEGTGYPSFEFRRYANGAAFWAKKGSGYNSGDQRPVLCVDLHQGPQGPISLSGVALDAVLRYDLGKIVGQDSGMQKTYIELERGTLQFSRYDVTDQERFDSVRKRPHEQPFEQASTITGRLMALKIKGVTAKVMFDGTSVREVEMSGDTAYFVYRYAWRKGEDSGRFMIAEDAIGPFKKQVEIWGDGPGGGESWTFAKGKSSHTVMGEFDGNGPGRTVEDIDFRAANVPADRAPAAQCTRTTIEDQDAPAYRCTGI